MCGIIGLLIKTPKLRSHLGEWMTPMLIGMTQRGPDSAGLAIYSTPPKNPDALKISVYSGLTADGDGFDWKGLAQALSKHLGHTVEVETKSNHAILTFVGEAQKAQQFIKEFNPKLHLLSLGRSIDLYKDVGLPGDVASRYHFSKMTGTHVIGHTRMATESAVTPDRAHPFTAGRDFCMVHNGSLSNPYQVRRMLEPQGIKFDTDNDTESACRFIEWRLREGDTLSKALQTGFEELDGFYTLLMGTANEMALIRDPFACKPAIVAETDDYVAISSEFRSLAHLPDVEHATIFEPAPEEMYVWKI